MSISKKSLILSCLIVTFALVLFVVSYLSVRENLRQSVQETITRLDSADIRMIENQIISFSDNLANFLVSIEDEIDKRMLNAAIVLQTRLLMGDIDDAEMSELTKMVGMSDLYITDMDGIFIQSTEKASIGISLFDIWDGYRMIVNGKAVELHSPIKIKVETGEIFKFSAIPRLGTNKEVTGILETALEASSSVGKTLQLQIENNPQLNFINIIESSGLVLTENNKSGSPRGAFKVGDTLRNHEILNVAKDGKPLLKWSEDKKSVFYYKPIKRLGFIAYVLCLSIDPSSYLDTTAYINSQFTEFEKICNSSVTYVQFVSGCLIAVTILLYMFFISFGMLRPLKELSNVMKDISEGEGDLTKRLEIKSNNEIGSLATMFNEFITKIMETVGQAKNATYVVTKDSSDVMLNIESSHKSLKTESDSVQELSANIAEQARGVVFCDEISDQLLKDYEYLSSQISEATGVIDRIMKNKEQGVLKILDLTEKNSIGIERNEKAAKGINELNSQITDITNIIDEIKKVAKQTLLLSFNASIEAASAGENGKGFAVVAEAIKMLAAQAADSTHRIESIIVSISKSCAESVSAVMEVMEIANEQNICAEEMRGAFSSISSEIESINTVFSNVNQSLAVVSSVSKKISDGIRDIREIGHKNESRVKLVNESMITQVATVENIKKLSDDMSYTINHLKETLNRFVVE